MKTVMLMLIAGLFIFSVQGVAQKAAKKEAKEWKKRAKEYAKKPQILKKLIENKEKCDLELDSMTHEVATLSSEVEEKNSKIASLDGQLTLLRQELTVAKAEMTQLKSSSPRSTAVAAAPNKDFDQGIIFRVQIGAFRNPDLSKYFDNNPNFFGQAVESGAQKATIGVFRDYTEADQFKKYMRTMGVRDAWIVPFRDGQRVELREVMGAVSGDRS